MPDLAELEVWLKLRDEELKQKLGAVDKRLDKFEGDTTRKIIKAGEAWDGFGTSATRAGQALAPLSAVIAGIAGYGVKVAAEYQKSLNVFQAVSNAPVEAMEKVRAKAVELGRDLQLPGTSAKDAMDTMVELSKAGLNVANTMEAARGSIMLAAAGSLENARAAEIQANAMNAFNLAGTESMRVADLFSKAANASSAGVEDLAQAFAMGASSAYQANLTIEEYTATLAAMANAGIKGSDSGTAVKSMLISLTAPADDAKKAMDLIGLSYFDSAGKARPFLDVTRDLRESLEKLTQQQQADIMRKIFGTDGVRAAQIITGLGDGFDKLVDQMEGAKGSASKMAESMNKGVLGALDALRSSVETLLLTEGEKGLPALEGAIRGLAEQISKLADMPEPLKNLIIGVGAFVAIAGPALMVVGSMSTGIACLMTAYAGLTGAVGIGGAAAGAGAGATGALGAFATALTGPVGLAVAAGVVAIGGLALAYNHVATEGDRYVKTLDEEWKKQAEATSAKLDHIKAVQPLIKEYDGLRVQVGKNTEQSKKMKDILDKIVAVAPELISSFDASGRAIDIYTDAYKRLGDAAEEARKKARGAAIAAFEGVTKTNDAELRANNQRQDALQERIEGLKGELAKVNDPANYSYGNDKFVRQRRKDLFEADLRQAQEELAQLVALEKKLRDERQALNKSALEAAKAALGKGGPSPKKDPSPAGGNGNSNGNGNGSGKGGATGQPVAEKAREIADNLLISIGRAVRSPGPDGEAACASFASTVLAYYTKGLTDEGGRVESSARGLVDRLIKAGGKVSAAAAASAGDIAFRKGSGPSGMHVGVILGDGRIMDMNGQRDGKRNTLGYTSDKGWNAVGVPSKFMDKRFMTSESSSMGTEAGEAFVRSYLKPWESIELTLSQKIASIAAQTQRLTEPFQRLNELARETFAKPFFQLSPQHKDQINSLVLAEKQLADLQFKIASQMEASETIARIGEQSRMAADPVLKVADSLGYTVKKWEALTEAQRGFFLDQDAKAWFDSMSKVSGIGNPGLPEPEAPVRANFGSKSMVGSPFFWAEPSLRIIEDINRSYDEYLENLANEKAYILATSEAERIRLDLAQQHKGWTEDMISSATKAALDVEAVRDRANQIQDIVGGMAGAVGDSLDDLFALRVRRFLDNTYKGWVDMIADMTKSWIQSQLANIFSGLVGSLFGGSKLKGTGTTSLGMGPGVFAYGARADGGPVSAGMPYLVGERGPELIVPSRAGNVYSNSDTSQIVSAINSQNTSKSEQPIYITINVQANDPGAFVASERQIEQAVAQAVRRGLRR